MKNIHFSYESRVIIKDYIKVIYVCGLRFGSRKLRPPEISGDEFLCGDLYKSEYFMNDINIKTVPHLFIGTGDNCKYNFQFQNCFQSNLSYIL